jgi:hypothetical protein
MHKAYRNILQQQNYLFLLAAINRNVSINKTNALSSRKPVSELDCKCPQTTVIEDFSVNFKPTFSKINDFA